MDMTTPRPLTRRPTRNGCKIGLALGGGAARGWSHIGVMRALQAEGIVPDVIAGCSVGAVVGGCYAAGKLDELEDFVLSLTKRRVMGLLDFHIGGAGLIAGARLRRLLERDLAHEKVEALTPSFVAVATELGTGHEIWLTRGGLVDAMRASYALPGVFDPVRVAGRWLIDGALVNPVPVTAARALGADIVICVNLNGDIRLRSTVIQAQPEDDETAAPPQVMQEPSRWAALLAAARRGRERRGDSPGLAAVMIDAFNITQDRIARSRLAGDPPDVMISPKLAHLGLFEFHRGEECIDLGRRAAERAMGDVAELLGEMARI